VAVESAPAKPRTLKEALLAPYIWLLDLAIDKQIEQAMIERDAWSLYDMLCHSSKNTSLQTGL
jgi:rubrerythrin